MPSSHDNPHHERRWAILVVLGLAQLMVILDATIVNIALPSAQGSLGFSDDSRQWVITAYALAFGSLLLLGGRIGDLFGRKRVFIVGLIGFAVASAVGGAAQSFEVLVGARALQGVFGALLAPAALSLLSTTFTDPQERGKAFGVYGAIAGAGAAIGLLLGGILTEYLSWRWCLYVNLFFAVAAAAGGIVLLHNQTATIKPKLDIPGTITACLGLFALVYGFAEAESSGWGAPLTLAMLIGGVLLLVLFVAIQARSANPLLPLRVVRDRNRGGSYLAVGIVGAGMFGVFLFLTYYLQQNLGYSPVTTGLAFLPMSVAITISATLSTARLMPRLGSRPLVVTGMLLAAAGMAYLAQIGVASTYAADILPGLIVMGLGLGAVIAPSMSAATYGVEPKDAGVGSAMVNTTQQVGGSIGTAFLSTMVASAISGAMEGKVPSPRVAELASIHGYTTAFWWSAGIFLVGAVVSAALLERGAVQPVPGAEPVLAH